MESFGTHIELNRWMLSIHVARSKVLENPNQFLHVRAALSHGFRGVFTQKVERGPPQKERNELQKSQDKKRLFMVFLLFGHVATIMIDLLFFFNQIK